MAIPLDKKVKYQINQATSTTELGRAKGHLSTTKTAQNKNKDKIAAYAKEIDVIKKYRRQIDVIEEGNKTLKIGMGNKKKRIQN